MLKDTTVLMVEDEENVALPALYLLRRIFKNVLHASDGNEGLSMLKVFKPEIVITDVAMPGVNGIQMIAEIRNINPDIPIIVITAVNPKILEKDIAELNVTAFITKPVTKETLFEAIESASL